MSKFSSAVKISDLNDYLRPAAICVKSEDDSKTSQNNQKKKVEINLNDCLSCSGCITSAETTLVMQHTIDEIEKNHLAGKQIVVSITLPALLSLTVLAENSDDIAGVNKTIGQLAAIFRSLGAAFVIDDRFAHEIAVRETLVEYRERVTAAAVNAENRLPILTSVCPGFVCYAEKRNSELLLPLLSKVKSPQQIMAALLKRFWSAEHYFVSVQPCFDKKLEAARDLDVDCVVTPIEILQLLESREQTFANYDSTFGFDRYTIVGNQKIALEKNCGEHQPIERYFGSGSGGYAATIINHILNDGRDPNVSNRNRFEYRYVKNDDFQELIAVENQQELVSVNNPTFAVVNGFKNIQNFVMKQKRGQLHYDFVEVMACPSGCLNGGAQHNNQTKNFLQQINELYEKLPLSTANEPQSSINHKTTTTIETLFEKIDADVRKELLFAKFTAIRERTDTISIARNW